MTVSKISPEGPSSESLTNIWKPVMTWLLPGATCRYGPKEFTGQWSGDFAWNTREYFPMS